MTERHLIAYGLLVLIVAVIGYGIHRWRRAAYLRRHPRRFGNR